MATYNPPTSADGYGGQYSQYQHQQQPHHPQSATPTYTYTQTSMNAGGENAQTTGAYNSGWNSTYYQQPQQSQHQYHQQHYSSHSAYPTHSAYPPSAAASVSSSYSTSSSSAYPPPPPPPPSSQWNGYPQSSYSNSYNPSSYPPPPPPPPPPSGSSGYTSYHSNYASTTSTSTPSNALPALSSSFVPASTPDPMSTTSLPSASSALSSSATTSTSTTTPSTVPTQPSVGRGVVHLKDGSSIASVGPVPTPQPVSNGIQFKIGAPVVSTGTSSKKSRWGATTRVDLTEAKPVSQTVDVPPSVMSTSSATAAIPPYSYAAAVASSLPQVAPPPPQPSAISGGSIALLSYIDRSLSDPSCPPSQKSAVEEFLQSKIAHAPTTDWAKEPLAYAQMMAIKQTITGGINHQQKPLQTQQHNNYTSYNPNNSSYNSFNNSAPSSFHSHPLHSPSNSTSNRFSNFLGTGTNNIPLGVRNSVPSSMASTFKESKEVTDEDEFIPMPNMRLNKKRSWPNDPTDDADEHGGPMSHKKSKKSKKSKLAATVNAHDLAKVADRAERFASYNAEVARSTDVFKNPIQRHLFTAERSWDGGDDDLQLDWSSLHIVGTCTKLEKKYLRLTQAPDPSVVRPEPVLRQAIDMILHKWRSDPTGTSEKDHIHDYKYTCEQLKSIRQDLTVQHLIHSPLTVEVYEQHARIAFEVRDFSEYNQCQTQLKNLYIDNPNLCANRVEFTTYRILYNLLTHNRSALTEMLREIQTQRFEEEKQSDASLREPLLTATREVPSSPISIAFKLALAALQEDYYNFFRLVPSLRFQGTTLIQPYVAQLRVRALTTLIKAFRPGKLELGFFIRTLGWKEGEEESGKSFLRSCGLVFNQDGVVDAKASEIHSPEEDETEATSTAHGVTHALV